MKKNDFWPLLGNFFKLYPKQRNYSSNTVSNWRYTWNIFLDWLINFKGKSPSSITMETIDATLVCEFLDDMVSKRKWSPQTRNERLSMLRSFFEYAAGINSLYYSKVQELSKIKKMKCVDKSGIIDYIPKSALTVLLAAPDASKRLGCRDQFYMSLAYDLAARTSEMTALKVRDFDEERRTVLLMGKGSKQRVVPVSSQAVKLYERYMKIYHPDNAPDALLFYTRHNGMKTPMSSDTVARLLDKYALEARKGCPDMPPKVRPHQVFRVSRAMHLLQSDAPLSVVSMILGHSDPITTVKHYAAADTEMKRKLMERASKEMLSGIEVEEAVWHDKDIIGRLYFENLL